MRDLSRRQLRRLVGVAALSVVAISVVVGDAFGGSPANVAAGQKLFASSGCGGCHAFKYAGAKGSIGPSLDKVVLTLPLLEKAIAKGGAAVMTPAQLKKYKFKMTPFAGKLSAAQIATLAGFVLGERNKAPAAGTTTTTASGGGGTTTTTPSSGAGGSTGGGGTTTTTGGGTDVIDNCPAGKTIPTSGNTDADDDDTGAQTDGDGCI